MYSFKIVVKEVHIVTHDLKIKKSLLLKEKHSLIKYPFGNNSESHTVPLEKGY